MTVIPVEMQRRLNIQIDTLKLLASEIVLVSNRNWFVRLYNNPEKWHSEITKIDQWCAESLGCFSKARAEKSLSEANDFIEASALLKEWR